MLSLGLLVRLEAKPGKEKEVAAFLKQGLQRSEERRVGKECSLTCRSRWSPYH